MKSSSARVSLVVLAVLATAAFLLPSALTAENSVRECIHFKGNGDAYVLPADGQWHAIGHLEFNHQDVSDYIAQASLFFTEGNTPDSRVEYQFTLDGVPMGWYTKRVPDSFPTSQSMVVNIANVASTPTQHHFLGVRARNLSPNPVYYAGFWITPYLIDGAESRGSGSASADISIGSTWTTINTATVSVSASRYLYLTAYAAIQNGISQDEIQFRFLRNGVVLDTMTDAVPDQFPDGVHLSHIDTQPGTGTKTITLQARSPSGLGATIRHRELMAQEVPNYLMLEVFGSASIPNDGAWHTVAGPVTKSYPVSTNGTAGTGFAYVTTTGTLDREAQVQMELTVPGLTFDIGWVDFHPTGRTRLGGVPSDWEVIGLGQGQNVSMELQARGLCPGATPNMTISDAKAQIMVLPSKGYSFHDCSRSPATCCANKAACEVYQCRPDLTQVFDPPVRDCFGS